MIDDGAPARPAWRTVHKREDRRAKAKAKALPPPTPASPPAALVGPPHPDLPAWAQWKRACCFLAVRLAALSLDWLDRRGREEDRWEGELGGT